MAIFAEVFGPGQRLLLHGAVFGGDGGVNLNLKLGIRIYDDSSR